MSLSNKIRGVREIWQFDNRWKLLFDRTFRPGKHVQYYHYRGMEIMIDHSAGDANGAREVLTSPMYRQYIRQMELPKMIRVLDLGSNNGGFPLLVQAEGFEIEKLVCVEMNPVTFRRLEHNILTNIAGSASLVNAAICGDSRQIAVRLGSGGAGDNIYQDAQGKSADVVNIQGKTLDETVHENFGDETVDICKIDIEGAEFEILGSGSDLRLRQCRYLLIEIHHEADRRRSKAIEAISRHGFSEIDGERKKDELHYVHFFVNDRLRQVD